MMYFRICHYLEHSPAAFAVGLDVSGTTWAFNVLYSQRMSRAPVLTGHSTHEAGSWKLGWHEVNCVLRLRRPGITDVPLTWGPDTVSSLGMLSEWLWRIYKLLCSGGTSPGEQSAQRVSRHWEACSSWVWGPVIAGSVSQSLAYLPIPSCDTAEITSSPLLGVQVGRVGMRRPKRFLKAYLEYQIPQPMWWKAMGNHREGRKQSMILQRWTDLLNSVVLQQSWSWTWNRNRVVC